MKQKRTKGPLSRILLSAVIACGLIPALAFAAFSDQGKPVDDVSLLMDSTRDKEYVEESAADGIQDAPQSDSMPVPAPPIGGFKIIIPGQTQEDAVMGSSIENEDDASEDYSYQPHDEGFSGASASSFRFSGGEIIPSRMGADTDSDYVSFAIATMSIERNQSGYAMFNWFDPFTKGNATGSDYKRGVDVSQWNGDIDWGKVKASGVDFAIIRCGYGDDVSYQDDSKWLQNVRGCINAGMPFGVYIYSYATNTTMANSEASHVLRCLGNAGLSPSKVAYPIYLDMEDNSTVGANLASIAQTFCERISSNGYDVGVYSSKSWWENKLTDSRFGNWRKWVAEWNASNGLQYNGSANFANRNMVWQFSDYGKVPGIPNRTDLNYSSYTPGSKPPEASSSTPSQNYPEEKNDNGVVVYRVFNPKSGEHLYTKDPVERNALLNAGWNNEGTGWIGAFSGNPVYRVFNPKSGEHLYTQDSNEKNALVNAGWNDEGISWYSDKDRNVPIMRVFNPKSGEHLFTRDTNEKSVLVNSGWNDEGIGWHGVL